MGSLHSGRHRDFVLLRGLGGRAAGVGMDLSHILDFRPLSGTASFEEREPLYRSRDGSSPAFTFFPEPILIRAGDGLRYRCLFDNDKMIPLIFGETSEDEMCILYGFYY